MNERPYYETAEDYNRERSETEQQIKQEQYYSNVNLDSEGRPMKNRFAVQLVFAIVEILLCCVNPVAMVLAIIALVFAIQANSAYAYNREIDFKVKSKVASILLIIGGIWTTISLIITILLSASFMAFTGPIMRDFGQIYPDSDIEDLLEDFMENYDMEGDIYKSEGYGKTLGKGDEPLREGYNTFTLNGSAYSIPMTFEQFSQMGYALEEGYENYILEPNTYESMRIHSEDGYVTGMIRVSNNTGVLLPLEECIVDYIQLENVSDEKDKNTLFDLTFANGLTVNSSYEEIEAYMGKPTYMYIEEGAGYANYTWNYYGEEYQTLDIHFKNGVIYKIGIE